MLDSGRRRNPIDSRDVAICEMIAANTSYPGEMTIYNMRQVKAAYNLISNNCQNFALAMLGAIQVGKHREFGTTFAIYQRATGKGKIKDLFADDSPSPPPEEVPEGDLPEGYKRPQRVDTVLTAAQVMDENTTKLDHHSSL